MDDVAEAEGVEYVPRDLHYPSSSPSLKLQIRANSPKVTNGTGWEECPFISRNHLGDGSKLIPD